MQVHGTSLFEWAIDHDVIVDMVLAGIGIGMYVKVGYHGYTYSVD